MIALNRVGTGAEASAPTSVRLRLSRFASLSLRPLNRTQDEGSKARNPPLIPRPEVRQGASRLTAGRTQGDGDAFGAAVVAVERNRLPEAK